MYYSVSDPRFTEQVEDFIKRKFKKEADWCNGNCYWFAHILSSRFIELRIWYEHVEGHFLAGDFTGTVFFDWSGFRSKDSLQGIPVLWSRLQVVDPKLAKRVERDCIT